MVTNRINTDWYVFIDLSTGWFEIVEVRSVDKFSTRVSQLFNQIWLYRHPSSKQVHFYHSSGFKKDDIPLLKGFTVKPKSTSIKNSQSNKIVEQVHQAVVDIIRTYELEYHTFNEIDL